MARKDYTLNHRNLEDILTSEEVIKALHDVADEVVAVHPHPEDLEIDEWVGRTRARVSVKTVGIQAHVREARDHDLVWALGQVQSGG